MLNNQNIKEGSYLLDFVGADEGVLSVIDRNEFNSFVVIDKDDINTIKFHRLRIFPYPALCVTGEK